MTSPLAPRLTPPGITPRGQSLQAALRIAHAGKFASGGMPPPGVGNIAHNVTGGLQSPVAGRTDHLPISVPDGAYVLPADVVSALGEGNTQAGMKILDAMFQTHSMPMPGQPQGQSVDIAAAGGEFIVPPDAVARLGNGDRRQGHAVLDSFVKAVRSKNVKTLQKMPGPVK